MGAIGHLASGVALVIAIASGTDGAAFATDRQVDVALVIAGDVSGSMIRDLRAQREGFVAAFRDPAIVEAIVSGPLGQVAVTYVEWAGAAEQWVVVPWTIIGDEQAADAFAGRLEDAPAVKGYQTAMASGLIFAAAQFAKSDVMAMRETIDVSGDGPNNAGPPIAAVRDFVVARGITINGLPVALPADDGPYGYLTRRDDFDLHGYFEDCVIGGPGAFAMPVSRTSEVATAIRRKLVIEIAGLPARVIPAAFVVPAATNRCQDDASR